MLVPKVAFQLQQANSFEEIDEICKQYALIPSNVVYEGVSDQLSSEVFQLTATLSNQKPSRFVFDLEAPHWIQLQSIDYTDQKHSQKLPSLSSFEYDHYLKAVS